MVMANALPKSAMEPPIIAFWPSRTQTSCAMALVMRASAGRPISFRSCTTCSSSMILRNGDCSSWMASAERAVENGVASGVAEIRQHQHVFIGEPLAGGKLHRQQGQARDQHHDRRRHKG